MFTHIYTTKKNDAVKHMQISQTLV